MIERIMSEKKQPMKDDILDRSGGRTQKFKNWKRLWPLPQNRLRPRREDCRHPPRETALGFFSLRWSYQLGVRDRLLAAAVFLCCALKPREMPGHRGCRSS